MASAGSSKSKAVSSDPMNSLRAHVAQQRAGIREELKPKKGLSLKGGFAVKSNRGIERRLEADAAALRTSKRDADSYRANLEHKAKTYERLERGKTGGLTEEQIAALSFDVDRKVAERSDSSETESGDESNSVSSEAMTDMTDELGRTRRVKRSEVPRHYRNHQMSFDNDEDVIRGPGMHHNPVYVPDEDRIAKIREAAKETPLESHWNPKGENRQKGAAYMNLGGTEEEREKIMADLEAARQETIRKRQETGADTEEATSVIATASLKRKERNEERLAMMTVKRRKVASDKTAMDFLAKIEGDLALQGRLGT